MSLSSFSDVESDKISIDFPDRDNEKNQVFSIEEFNLNVSFYENFFEELI